MYQRHPANSNLTLHFGSEWHGLSVLSHRGPLVISYLERLLETLSSATNNCPRSCVIRFDLRIPVAWPEADTAVISRCLASLKAKIQADEIRKSRKGKRVYHCQVRYIWAKERDTSTHCHYHVAILLNRDAYFTLGRFKSGLVLGGNHPLREFDGDPGVNMADRIIGAWASALGCTLEQSRGLVHFPENAVYDIDANSSYFCQQFAEVFRRLSYLAKADTKHYGDNSNSFGCSRI